MALDLMIRGSGSNRRPDEHLAALPGEYQGWRLFIYGQPLGQSAFPATANLTELAGWIEEAGEANLLLYGDDELFRIAEPEAIGTIWVTMGADRDGVREVWRLRQQYAWLAKKRLALLVEVAEGDERPDADRLMRLTRAVQVLTFPAGPAMTEPVWASVAPEVATTAPAFAPPASEEAAPALTTPVSTETEPVWGAPAEAEAAPAATLEVQAEATPEVALQVEAEETPEVTPEVEAEETQVATTTAEEADPAPEEAEPAEATPEPVLWTPTTPTERGADLTMTTPQAEQAILQRYALVRERRTTTARAQEVDAEIKGLMKEIFVARPEHGTEAAADFESHTKRLADFAAEYAQLSRSMARIEEELAKLAWLKDELEI